jgi:Rieske Fe-S protein
MTTDDDRYPPESDRRRFVKGVVGGSALAGVGTGGAALVETATADRGEGGGDTRYRGARRVDGPAPRAMPQVPLEVDDEGYLRGIWPETRTIERENETVTVAREELGGVTYSRQWFQYCGVQNYPGLQLGDRDNYLRYVELPPSNYRWQSEMEPGSRLHVDHFADYEEWGNGIGDAGIGKPARARWRSEDLPEGSSDLVLPVVVIRSPRIEERAADSEWLSASTDRGFVGILNKCTHFCCNPGYKESSVSAKFDAENGLYCGCHQSVYDPFDLVERVFTALPRREDR